MIGTVRIRALCAIFAFALGGCVSIDSRASREEVDAARKSGAKPDAAWCAKEAELVKPLALK